MQKGSLSEKIFLDRYALKDLNRDNIVVGDLVIRQGDNRRDLANVVSIESGNATIQMQETKQIEVVSLDLLDKPLEKSYEECCARVAKAIAGIERESVANEWESKFYQVLASRDFVPGGRILANAGSGVDTTLSNCYVIESPKDSRAGIYKSLEEWSELMSRGGGVGVNISTLRPRNANVMGVNGRSSGAISWGAMFSLATGTIQQGGSRRGAGLLILEAWHPDLPEFITIKKNPGALNNVNISVGITHEFMAAVNSGANWDLVFPDTSLDDYDTLWDGDLAKWKAAGLPLKVYGTVDAQELWHSICEGAWSSAEPGLFLIDVCNDQSNSYYFNRLQSPNPCLIGTTTVSTDQGLVSIKEMFDNQNTYRVALDSRFGSNYTQAQPATFSGNKDVYRLQTVTGPYLDLTLDHKVMTGRGWVEAGKLTKDDQIHLADSYGHFGNEGSEALGAVMGWVIADGTLSYSTSHSGPQGILYFYAEKMELGQKFLEYTREIVKVDEFVESKNRKYSLDLQYPPRKLKECPVSKIMSVRLGKILDEAGLNKESVPAVVFKGTEACQRAFLQAIYSADGHFEYNDKKKYRTAVLSSSTESLLRDVQKLMLNFGVTSRLYLNRRKAGIKLMPDNKVGGNLKEYHCKANHTLVVSGKDLVLWESTINFMDSAKKDRFILTNLSSPYSKKDRLTPKFLSLTFLGNQPTYDISVPGPNSFIANGAIVHNCGEQPLPPYGVCALGHFNLANMFDSAITPFRKALNAREALDKVDWGRLHEAVNVSTRFMDNTLDYSFQPLQKVKDRTEQERRIGMGTLGLAELLLKVGLRYGSPEAIEFCDELFDFIQAGAYAISEDLGKEKGSFKAFNKELTKASLFMQAHGHDPEHLRNVCLLTQAPTGTTATMMETSTGVEPFFAWEWMRSGRLGNHIERVKVAQEYYDETGATSFPDFFVNAMSGDITAEEHVLMQAAIQKHTDSAISKTINMPSTATVEDVASAYQLLYSSGCKGGTVYRDKSRMEQVLNQIEEVKEEPKKIIKARPRVRDAKVITVRTSVGSAHVTLTVDEDDKPLEVFIDVGKGGSDVKAIAEAIGRLISLVLRIDSTVSPTTRLEEVVKQLKDIGGARQMGFGKNKSKSLPDSIAKAIEELNNKVEEETELVIESAGKDVGDPYITENTLNADMCPSCGNTALIQTDGCCACLSCGHSEC